LCTLLNCTPAFLLPIKVSLTGHPLDRTRHFLFLGEGEAGDGLAFEGFVGVEVLLGGLDVAVTHQFLHGDDVTAAFQQSRGIGVAEFVERGVLDFGGFGDFL
jgi:hypothetical protein